MNNEILLSASGVSKKFCKSLKKSLWYGLKDVARDLVPLVGSDWTTTSKHAQTLLGYTTPTRATDASSVLREEEFWAVKGVSFELRRGECLGLIGRNGAGKTTLLKMLNGLIKPDDGRIEIRGRVGALISLGAGFNPILTGRENIYVNASILGMRKQEVDAKMSDILDFADMHDFIDSPVQTYSSGMQVRLGFSVATALVPDILLLDEVMAVGDAAFRAKCYTRINRIAENAAVIFVSHNMEQVGQVCSRALVMKSGRAIFSGDVAQGVHCYSEANNSTGADAEIHVHRAPGVEIQQVTCSDKVSYGGDLRIGLDCTLPRDIPDADVKVTVFDDREQVALEAYTKTSAGSISLRSTKSRLQISVGPLFLRSGSYLVSVVVLDRPTNEHLYWGSRAFRFTASGPAFGNGHTIPPIRVSVF